MSFTYTAVTLSVTKHSTNIATEWYIQTYIKVCESSQILVNLALVETNVSFCHFRKIDGEYTFWFMMQPLV